MLQNVWKLRKLLGASLDQDVLISFENKINTGMCGLSPVPNTHRKSPRSKHETLHGDVDF
jgi:hypothetical protein